MMQAQPQHPWGGTRQADRGSPESLRKQVTALPNLLSLLRVVPIPPIYLCLRAGEPFYEGIAAALIAVALSTDFLDGYLARRQGLKTPLGLILDPTADKILISSLAILGVLFKGLPTWMAAVIVGKDAVVFSGAALIFLRRGLVLPSDRWGRITTVVASIALGLYFLFPRSLGPYAVGLLICCIPLSVGAYGTRFIRLLRASGPTTSSAR